MGCYPDDEQIAEAEAWIEKDFDWSQVFEQVSGIIRDRMKKDEGNEQQEADVADPPAH